MPNWCEGNLRIRGTKENIKNFLENEIVIIKPEEDFGSYIEVKPKMEESEYLLTIYYPIYQNKPYGDYYIKNTKSHGRKKKMKQLSLSITSMRRGLSRIRAGKSMR